MRLDIRETYLFATVNLIPHLASLAQLISSQDCLMRLHSRGNRFNCYRKFDPTLGSLSKIDTFTGLSHEIE
jgi:hypothetical protein